MTTLSPDDIKRVSSLAEAGIKGGIHSDSTLLVALKDGSLWIWKQTGVEERDEIFMYHLALALFRGIVPETEPLYIPKLGWGSAQRKVSGVPAARVDGLHGYFHGNDEIQADLVAMIIMDYLTGNPDRHANNWFLMETDRLAAIDNGWAGKELVIEFGLVLEPARLAGIEGDKKLWPRFLNMVLWMIQDLHGKGDQARAIAQEIGIEREQAVDMVRLWEPKLEKLRRFVQAEVAKNPKMLDGGAPDITLKARTYIETPEEAPEGTPVETGPRGGLYYESEPNLPGFEETPQQRARHDIAPQTILEASQTDPESLKALMDMQLEAVGQALLRKPEYKDYDNSTPEVRGAVKDGIARRLAEKTGLDYATVTTYIQSWSGSSSDNSFESLSMQMAAAELFEIEPTEFIKKAWDGLTDTLSSRTVPNDVAIGAGKTIALKNATAILQAMYDDTQERLKAAGVEKVTLFRGMRWWEDVGDNPAPDAVFVHDRQLAPGIWTGETEFHSNPLSSWAYSYAKAMDFANYKLEDAEEYGEEVDYDDPEVADDAEEALRDAYGAAYEEGDDPDIDAIADEDERYDAWKEKFLGDYGGNAVMWATETEAIEIPVQYPAITRMLASVTVPREKIIATAVTGLGCLEEDEIVITGGKFNQRVYTADDPDGTNEFPSSQSIKEWEGAAPEPAAPEPGPAAATEEITQKPGRIPEELMTQRLEEIRTDPLLKPDDKYNQSSDLIFEWWRREDEPLKGQSDTIFNKYYNEKMGWKNEAAYTQESAVVHLAQATLALDYQERLEAARQTAGVEPDWLDLVKYQHQRDYDRAHIKLLRALAGGALSVDDFNKKVASIYSRVTAQAKLREDGYDSTDPKIVAQQQEYIKARDAIAASGPMYGETYDKLVALNKKHDAWLASLPKMSKMMKALKVYLNAGEEAPEGVEVKHGPRGGRYYDAQGRGPGADDRRQPGSRPSPDRFNEMQHFNEYAYMADARAAAVEAAGGQRYVEVGAFDPRTRTFLKQRVAERIAEATGLHPRVVQDFISAWASSASDNHPVSLSVQLAAAEMFGVEPPEFIKHAAEAASGKMQDWIDDARKIVPAVYADTQAWLKKHGIKKLYLARGMHLIGDELPDDFRLKLSDEQVNRLYKMRMQQFDRSEAEALAAAATFAATRAERGYGASVAAHGTPTIPGLISDDPEKVKQLYDEARKSLRDDIHENPAHLVDVVHSDALGWLNDEWREREDAIDEKYRHVTDEWGTPAGRAADKKKRAEEQANSEKLREGKDELDGWLNEMLQWDDEVSFQQNPLSSWSSDARTASAFAERSGDESIAQAAVVMYAEVPAERIVSTPFTGFGCLTEQEILVAGGPTEVFARAVGRSMLSSPQRDWLEAKKDFLGADKYWMMQGKSKAEAAALEAKFGPYAGAAHMIHGKIKPGKPD